MIMSELAVIDFSNMRSEEAGTYSQDRLRKVSALVLIGLNCVRVKISRVGRSKARPLEREDHMSR